MILLWCNCFVRLLLDVSTKLEISKKETTLARRIQPISQNRKNNCSYLRRTAGRFYMLCGRWLLAIAATTHDNLFRLEICSQILNDFHCFTTKNASNSFSIQLPNRMLAFVRWRVRAAALFSKIWNKIWDKSITLATFCLNKFRFGNWTWTKWTY